jgi:hypothetical protein
LQDKVGKVVLYTAAGQKISTFEDPYAVQQIAEAGSLKAGDYVVEIHGKDMRYYLKLQAGKQLNASVVISPNPFTGSFVIEQESSTTIESVRVFGADGREYLLPQKKAGSRWEVNTVSLPAGLYLVHITDNNGSRTEKAIKF